MIHEAIAFLEKELDRYLCQKFIGSINPVEIGNIATIHDQSNSNLSNKVVISLINIEEDRISKKPDNAYRKSSGVSYKNPEIQLNLFLLFVSNRNDYKESLQYLSLIIQFFQYNNVFSIDNFPEFPENIEKLIPDLVSLTLEQQNQLWSFLGGKQIPSVMYKFRMVLIDEGFKQSEGTLIKEIITEANSIGK